MKRLVVPALLGSVALGAAAQSASSVTLYGVVDAYAQFVNGSESINRIQSGGLSGSRFGFRGSEDLGGGMRAVFTLESGFNSDDGTIGQGGTFFGRQAFVGLQDSWGSVTLGRQYSSVYHATTDFSLFSNNPAGPSTAVIGGFGGGYEPVRGAGGTATPPAAGATGNGGPIRVNNALRYESPSWSGVRVSALYGAGEVAGATSDARLFDLGVRYTGGPFDALLSVLTDKALTGAVQATDATVTTLAGAYNFEPFRVVAGFLHFNDKRAADQDGRGGWLGGEWRMGKHTLRAQYVLNKPKFGVDNETKAFGVGWGYELSRRSQLYASLTRFSNDGQAGSGGLGRFNASLPAGVTRVGDNSLSEVVLGFRHSF